MNRYALTLSCQDRPGIVAEVTGTIAHHGGNILEAEQHDDRASGMFFMRVGFEVVGEIKPRDAISGMSQAIGQRLYRQGVRHRISDDAPKKVLILASKSDHCLADLLYRWRIGEMPMKPVGVVSNHERDSFSAVDLRGLKFTHLPVTAETRDDQEAEILRLFHETRADLVVLARYMRILSDATARALQGRCINIHHSFLPGFKGAKPYHQAHERGVKMIGATAHYVTADLDEGPIIAQDVEPISHRDTPDDLVRKGRDIERRVLARAVRAHLEDRVVIAGNRTVVFS